MKKKNYNPFKMWGSYLGAVLMSLIELSRIILTINNKEDIAMKITYIFFPIIKPYNFLLRLHESPINILPLILVLLFGFLMGWGIHSLVRVLRK